MAERVVVAMSGGVDSSVAAALLVRQGYEVIGITMQIWPEQERAQVAHHNGCCSLAAVDDARAVATSLGIPYYVLNMREQFQKQVVRYFIDEYLAGRTPNPCIACNREVKFATLLERALALGADKLATGHYASVLTHGDKVALAKASDPHKDQSYVLYGLTQAELAHVVFPVGAYRKDEIRAMARELGLVTWNKPDSQEICFVDDDYRDLMTDAVAALPPGRFRDVLGRDLGPSPGVAHFTIGQRRGIGLTASEPYYVVDLVPEQNVVVVGSRLDLERVEFEIEGCNWILWDEAPEVIEASVRIRSHAPEAPCTVRPLGDGRAAVRLHASQSAITPGQAAVFYDGAICLGGGTIRRS